MARIKRHTKLPVCVGFGVRTAEQARAIAHGADGVVVGSALVDAVRKSLDADGKATAATVPAVAGIVRALAKAYAPPAPPAASPRLRYDRLLQDTGADLETAVGLRLQRVERVPGCTVGVDDLDFLHDLACGSLGLAKLETPVTVDRSIALRTMLMKMSADGNMLLMPGAAKV